MFRCVRWNSCIARKGNDTTLAAFRRGRSTCRGARHYRNLIKLRDNICCRLSTTRRRRGEYIPHSVIANSELPLRILKFRAPAAARYPGENATVLLLSSVVVDVDAQRSRNALWQSHLFVQVQTRKVRKCENINLFFYLKNVSKYNDLCNITYHNCVDEKSNALNI